MTDIMKLLKLAAIAAAIALSPAGHAASAKETIYCRTMATLTVNAYKARMDGLVVDEAAKVAKEMLAKKGNPPLFENMLYTSIKLAYFSTFKDPTFPGIQKEVYEACIEAMDSPDNSVEF